MSALNLNCKHFKVVILSSKHLRNTFTLSISPNICVIVVAWLMFYWVRTVFDGTQSANKPFSIPMTKSYNLVV